MKKIIFSILFVTAGALAMQAQSSGCAKSCAAKSASCQSKVAAASTVVPAEHQEAAAKLASTQRTIEERKSENGVSYVRRVNNGGTVSFQDVTYDAANNKFINVSPTEVTTTTATPAAGCGPAGATAAKSGCAATAGKAGGCCASKAKTTTAANTTNANEGKPVKTSGGTN